MRAKPDTKSTIIARVNIGETVTVMDELAGWDQVRYNGKTGYMMTDYLLFDQEAPDEQEDTDDTVTVKRADLETWADVLEEMARDIREAFGHG